MVIKFSHTAYYNIQFVNHLLCKCFQWRKKIYSIAKPIKHITALGGWWCIWIKQHL